MQTDSAQRVTYYVVQGFTRERQGARMDPPIEARSEAAALRMAERMADRKASVIVLSRTGNPKTGEFDEPVVVRSYGALDEDDIPF